MADPQGEMSPQGAASGVPPAVKIDQGIPIIFADGASSHWFGSGLSKTHFARWDPDPMGVGPAVLVPILQMVMSTEGFASMVVFLDHRLDMMIASNLISAEQVNQLRGKLSKPNEPT